VFDRYADAECLRSGGVVMGAVQWANGADLAPDAMYDAIKTHGRWIVE